MRFTTADIRPRQDESRETSIVPERSNDRSFPQHFDGSRFFSPGAPPVRGFVDVLRWKLSTRAEPSPQFVSDVEPVIPPRVVEGTELRTTLVNHSTVLLQQSASTILTDPIWSERTSPLSWVGPRRHRAPGVRIDDLPRIDVVLLSHNHYDHLDLPTLRRLARRGQSTFVVPLGVARLLRSQGIEPVHELDWGEEWSLGATRIQSVPAVHFAGRGLFDRNKSLWCGYIITCPNGIIYFAGDTAFGNHFSQIRERFGTPRLALLPIGAYEPRWFMSPVHMAPEEAITAHKILGSRTSIAIHHGTFQLANDAIDTAKRQLVAASAPESFLILDNGQSATIV
jgi:L-ascorbate metabolism protein UlaG (beta-lactamase superfamily)